MLLFALPALKPFAELILTKDLAKSTALIVAVVEPVGAKEALPRCIDFITCVPRTGIIVSYNECHPMVEPAYTN